MQPGGGPTSTRPCQDRENTDPHPNPHPTAFPPQRSAALQAASDAKPKHDGADPPVKGCAPLGGDRPAGSGRQRCRGGARPGRKGRRQGWVGGRRAWKRGGGCAACGRGRGVESSSIRQRATRASTTPLDALANADGSADDTPLGCGSVCFSQAPMHLCLPPGCITRMCRVFLPTFLCRCCAVLSSPDAHFPALLSNNRVATASAAESRALGPVGCCPRASQTRFEQARSCLLSMDARPPPRRAKALHQQLASCCDGGQGAARGAGIYVTMCILK